MIMTLSKYFYLAFQKYSSCVMNKNIHLSKNFINFLKSTLYPKSYVLLNAFTFIATAFKLQLTSSSEKISASVR